MKPVAVSTRAGVAEAALEAFPKGNAVDAVVAGVFAAAALHPGVLLGPVQLLVGGPGAGPRAVDGRVRQPGLGAPRPRGFKEGDEVPVVARVGVPALPAALCTAHASAGSLTLAQALTPALARAGGPRARLLERIARRGAAAMFESFVADPLVALAGRVAGGVLTRQDLEEVRPLLLPCERVASGSGELAVCPWGARAVVDASAEAIDGARTHVLATGDVHGLTAIACFEVPDEGSAVEELGVTAPWLAEPVLRGRARVRPGEPRPAAAPMVLVLRDAALELALGVGTQPGAESALGALARRVTEGATLDQARSGTGALGVVRTRASLAVIGGAG
jgi:gamma-glutamyltranspeptidase/glutathione hydrolase